MLERAGEKFEFSVKVGRRPAVGFGSAVRDLSKAATTLRRIASVPCFGSSPQVDSASRGIPS
jgi:hypothetical protein